MRKLISVNLDIYNQFNKISNCMSINDLMKRYIEENKPKSSFDWEKFMDCVDKVDHEILQKISEDFDIKSPYIGTINPLKSDRDMKIFNALGFKLDDFMVQS